MNQTAEERFPQRATVSFVFLSKQELSKVDVKLILNVAKPEDYNEI